MSNAFSSSRRSHNAHAPHLFKTSNGSILHCGCCGRIQIAYRGLLLLITVDEFDTLRKTVSHAWDEIDAAKEAPAWRLSADTDTGGVSVNLRLEELRELHHLLQGAASMLALRNGLSAVTRGAATDTVPRAGRLSPSGTDPSEDECSL